MKSRQVLRAESRAKPIPEEKAPQPKSNRTLKKKALNKISLDATIKDITDENNAIARGEVWELDPKKRRPVKAAHLDVVA
jgi:hypothetical protein